MSFGRQKRRVTKLIKKVKDYSYIERLEKIRVNTNKKKKKEQNMGNN